ncbi:MAG: transposase, partial [Myxococcaceae bacterium]
GVDGFVDVPDDDAAWRRLKKKLYRTKWVSYAKAPFAGPESVYRYLGRYTHRVGLSNRRLLEATESAVTFRTWGEDTATLHPHEFLHRFLQHVLPHGFVKLRHYGLLAPGNVNTRLARARAVLDAGPSAPPTSVATVATTPAAAEQPATWRELLLRLTGIDVARCPRCGGAAISSRPLPRALLRDTS